MPSSLWTAQSAAMNRTELTTWALTTAGLLGLAFAVYTIMDRQAADSVPLEISGFVIDEPRALPAFTLRDGDDQAFTDNDFQGAWSFIYFGYTSCPDICPMSMVEMSRIAAAVPSDTTSEAINYYLVSVDPERDTPQRVGEYAAYFNADFRGLTGETEEIDKFATAAGVIYELPEAPVDDNYLVGHSSFITLINPQGEIHAFFTADLDGERIADDFVKILARR